MKKVVLLSHCSKWTNSYVDIVRSDKQVGL
jgi:hypothetical protein